MTMRFASRDLKGDRTRAWIFIVVGIPVLAQGLAAVGVAILGNPSLAGKALYYAPFSLIAGMGLVAMGWTRLREAASVEWEHELRVRRRGARAARRHGTGSRSRAASVEAGFRPVSRVPGPSMNRDFPGLGRSF